MGHDGLALIGVGVLALSFLLRLNPLFGVALAALASGLAAGLDPIRVLKAFGHAYNANRYVSLAWLVLPVIGLLERHGLQVRAGQRVAALRRATAGRILLAYLAMRQLTAALGLTALGGHAPMVRPLIAPMAEAADARDGARSAARVQRVRAFAASADNIGAFFGEDIFIAFGSILLIRGVLAGQGVAVEPLRLSLWAIPTALAAFAIHGWRLLRLDREGPETPAAVEVAGAILPPRGAKGRDGGVRRTVMEELWRRRRLLRQPHQSQRAHPHPNPTPSRGRGTDPLSNGGPA